MRSRRNLLLDTGPLVATLDARDQWHTRCAAEWPRVIHRCVTTEAVITEASHLVYHGGGPAHLPLDFVVGAQIPILCLETAAQRRAGTLMRQFADTPMDYADATLVVLAEVLRTDHVFSTDLRGFSVYPAPSGKGFRVLPEA